MTLEWVLDCTRCDEHTEFYEESDSVVRCTECGKRHAYESTVHK